MRCILSWHPLSISIFTRIKSSGVIVGQKNNHLNVERVDGIDVCGSFYEPCPVHYKHLLPGNINAIILFPSRGLSPRIFYTYYEYLRNPIPVAISRKIRCPSIHEYGTQLEKLRLNAYLLINLFIIVFYNTNIKSSLSSSPS
jgi:hypothetical protein